MKQISILSICGVAIAVVVLAGCGGKSTGTNGPPDVTTGECAIDNSSMPDNGQLDPAWQLIANTNSSLNYICPVKDEDYFWFTTTTDGTILSVHLWNNVTTSPLNLCYSIIPDTDHNQTLGSSCRGATIGQIDIQATHYIAQSGTYFIKVWAENGKEDRRNPYLVEIREVPDPDKYEPNNTKDQAKTVVANQKGYISYLGDQDWFKIDVTGTDKMLKITLATDGASELNLHYDVYEPDGSTLLNSGDKYDANNPLSINDMLALPQAGTYYVVISDKEGDTSSTTVGYTLTLELPQNPDTRDRTTAGNNSPANATPLPISGANPYIASRGDQDWYYISSTGVSIDTPKLLDIDVTFSDSSQVYPAADLLVADPNTSCSTDANCNVLSIDCETNRACFTGECGASNKCVGAGICLPSGKCAIRELVMRYSDNWREDYSVSGHPHHLKTVAPMYGNEYYILVRDFTGQYYDSTYSYTINVTVVNEPDTNEINSLYLPYVDDNQDKDFRGQNVKYAKDITCTLVPSSSPQEYDCGTITGYLSFRGDQDWYKLVNITGIREDPPNDTTQWKDWNIDIVCKNDASATNVNFEIFSGSDLRDANISAFQNGAGQVEIGGTTNQCSYLCGEYTLNAVNSSTYLRVQHSDRTKYDYHNAYTLTIKATLECPHNCGHCNPSCQDYPCPTPLTGGTGGCVPW